MIAKWLARYGKSLATWAIAVSVVVWAFAWRDSTLPTSKSSPGDEQPNLAKEVMRIRDPARRSVPLVRVVDGEGTFVGFGARASLNGGPEGVFLFDSGTTELTISQNAKVQPGQATGLGIVIQSAAGSMTDPEYRGSTFDLGSVVIDNPRYCFGRIPTDTSPPLMGLFGGNLLDQHSIELDGASNQLIAQPTGLDNQDGKWNKVTSKGDFEALTCAFNGHNGLFFIDTGLSAPVEIELASATADRFGIRFSQPIKADNGDSLLSATLGYIDGFQVGPIEEKHVCACIPTKRTAEDEQGIAGSIGVSFFEHRRCIFDYPHHRVKFFGQ